jgi:NAD(P) transhydrogenase subunit alpha
MICSIPAEGRAGESRVPILPRQARALVGLGLELRVEAGLAAHLGVPDSAWEEVGASIVADHQALLAEGDMVLRLGKPSLEDIALLKSGALHISYLDPFRDAAPLKAMNERSVSAVCMEMIPRTTLAQKMDALSSQANLGGYVAVVLAAEQLDRLLPMMMTPAGTLTPARVFIIGAGVAGLQAIATAKRLGARVEAFDTRPVVKEQVESLGAKFVEVDLGETGQTKDGYARELSAEQLELQRQEMARRCAQADIVITTAQLFGRPAPRILTAEMVAGMKPGSVIVDMAVETGGNVEGSELDQAVEVNGVRILGYGNLPGRVPVHASEMYSANLFNFVEHFWNKEEKTFRYDMDDEILKGALLCHQGSILNEAFKG